MPVPELYIDGIIKYMPLWARLLSFRIMLRFIYVLGTLIIRSGLLLGDILLYDYATSGSSFLLMNTESFPDFGYDE